MYIVFFLLMATNLLAQESYVIDSVCVGAERTYRRDGEAAYTYYWEIVDRQINDTLYLTGDDFTEINGTDTTWGNQILYRWEVVGEFDIIVTVFSEHNCDTIEQGYVKVFDEPFVDAGPDRIFCDALTEILISGDTAWNYSALYWETLGDGTFDNDGVLHPSYQFGAVDVANGEVSLVLKADGYALNNTCKPVYDTVTYYLSSPEITLDPHDPICYNDSNGYIVATIDRGLPPYSYAWEGPAGFVSMNADSIGGLWAGTYILTVTDSNLCVDIDTVELFNPPQLLVSIDNVTQVSCYAYADGSIAASASGGTGTLAYNWTCLLGATYTGDSIYNLPADTYYLTVTDENGCTYLDTVVLPEPELLLVDVTADDTILCEGEVVTLHGNPEGGTGELTQRWTGNGSVFLSSVNDSVITFEGAPVGRYVFTYTITDEALCEASDSIVLNVYPPSFSFDSLEVCAGAAPFPWNGLMVTSDADRVYVDTLVGMNQWGCDSIPSLAVKVLVPEVYDTTIYICENEAPFQPYGNITVLPDRDSIYLDTVRYADSGCDSLLITINVFSNPITDTLLYAELCAGADPYQWNNRWIQTDYSEIYLDTLVNQFGCDSLLTYDVTIIPPDTTYVFDTLCQDTEPYVWNSITVETVFDSTYQVTLQNQYLCDSVVELSVHVLPVTDTLLDLTYCAGPGFITLNNRDIIFDESRIYLDTLYGANQFGCDSLLTYDVTILPPDTTTIDTTICEGEPAFVWGVNTTHLVDAYTDSIYTDILQNQFGCDSIVYLDVEILRPVVITDTIEVCANEPAFTWHSFTIATDVDSIYADTLYYDAGCDSLRLELTLISNPVTDTLLDSIICEGSPVFAWNNVNIQTDFSQVYYDTLVGANQFGCDSFLVYDVIIVPAIKDTIPAVYCFGEPIANWYGQSISSETDSIYIHNVPGPGGCDTLLYYDVSILPVTDSTLYLTLCMGAPDVPLNNRTITSDQSRIYFDTIPNSYGCDSLMIYEVTVIPPDTTLHYDTLCVGDPEYDWNGFTVSTSVEDEYIASVPTASGCDSVAILYTTLINGTTTYDTVYACEEYTWTDGTGTTYYTSGDYQHTLGGATTCADTSWLHLVISPPVTIDTLVTHVLCFGDNNGAIDLSVSGGLPPLTFQWSNGATTQNISNLSAGIYTVTVSSTVTDTLVCTTTLDVEVKELDEILITLDAITDVLVAGESTGSIEVSVAGGTPGTGYAYEWTNDAGIVVGTDEDLFNQPAGDYTLTVTDANGCVETFTETITEPLPPDRFMASLDDEICYEDLQNYPVAYSIDEYLALDTSLDVYSIYGLDSASFTADSSVVSGSGYCYEEVRTYTVMDGAGNTLSATHTIIVNDTEDPTITCPPTTTVNNGIVPPPFDSLSFLGAGGSFADNCGIVRFDLVDEYSDNNSNPETITRVYQVWDYCGNINTCEHQIQVFANVSIALECQDLPDVYYECRDFRPNYRDIDDFEAAGGRYFTSPSAPIDTFFYNDVVQGTFCPTITRTYTLRNVAGLEVTCTKRFEVLDDEDPVLIFKEISLGCNDTRPPVYVSRDIFRLRSEGNTVTDNCGFLGLTLQFDREVIEGACPTIYKRYYTLVDGCGNRTQAIQYIYVNDTVPPVVTNFPFELTAECDVPEPYADVSAYVADDCGPVQITYHDSIGGADEPGVVYRIYTFSDGCNPVEVIQKITIELTNTPLLAAIDPLCQFSAAPLLPDTSLNGIPGSWLPATIDTDVPGDFEYIFYPDSGYCAGPASLTVAIIPEIQLDTILVDQGYNPNPVGSIDLAITGGSGVYTINWIGPAGFAANTANITGLYAGDYWVEVSDNIGCYDSISVSLLAFEPEFSCPPDTLIECPDVTQYPGTNNINELIVMGGYYNPVNIVANLDYFDVVDSSEYCLTIERTYVVEDIYGRLDSCTQTLNFYDNIPPVIIAPPGDTAECLATIVPEIQDFSDFMNLEGADAYDPNCTLDPSSFTVHDTTIILEPGRARVIYYFSIADICGNIGRDSAYYLITDDQAPQVFCADITVYLDENGEYHLTIRDSIAMIDSIYDNCTAPEDMEVVIEIDEVTCEDVESGTQVRITVYDEAGLSDNCVANLTVADTLPPTAICQNITVYLDDTGIATITPDMIDNGSFDNCGIETYQITPDEFDCFDVGDNLVTLIVTDYYGLRDTCEAIVTVIDPVDPFIECRPLQTIQLDEYGKYELSWDMVTDTVSDECGIDTVLLDDYELDCDNIGITTITVTAYDVNGNSSTCEATFEVFGNLPPNVVNDSAVTAVNVPVEIPVTNNDYDLKTNINLESLGVVIAPSHGSVVVDNNTGMVTYTPDLDYEGPDIFRYQICDDGIPCEPECGQAIVFIMVRPANNPPIAVDDYYEVPCGDLFGNVILNDSDSDGDDISVNPVPVTPPDSGALTLYSNGNFEYIPFEGFFGIDSFQYVICDNGIPSLCDTAWVYITRVPDNDCDGIPDTDDIDDDNDGIIDIVEGDRAIDSDHDGIPDSYDIDSDNDGIPDNIEGQAEGNYIPPTGRDGNGNGWDDAYDPENGGYPFTPEDTDGDSMADYLDIDSDNDGVFDMIEGHDDDNNGIADVLRWYSDEDRDGLDDAYDTYSGWADYGNETGSNAPIQDFDGDGIRDWRDTNDEDDQYPTVNEDLNGDGDYSNDDLDLDGYPEYLDTELSCELFIPEGFSPNDDGVHDFFQILCIQKYPNAKLMIFNRNGVKLWEKEHYGNLDVWGTYEDAWWWGTSENILTIGKSGGLPAGNYIYVLILNDGLGTVKNGTVMLAY